MPFSKYYCQCLGGINHLINKLLAGIWNKLPLSVFFFLFICFNPWNLSLAPCLQEFEHFSLLERLEWFVQECLTMQWHMWFVNTNLFFPVSILLIAIKLMHAYCLLKNKKQHTMKIVYIFCLFQYLANKYHQFGPSN